MISKHIPAGEFILHESQIYGDSVEFTKFDVNLYEFVDYLFEGGKFPLKKKHKLS